MKKVGKKMLSIFLVLTLVIALMPTMSSKLSAAPTIGEEGTTGRMVTFTYDNADATSVYVAGNFNNYSASSEDWKMEKNGEGIWELTKALPSGVYGYKFVVGAEWNNDPANYTYTNDGNSKLVVPGDVQSPVVEGDTVSFNFPVEQVTAVAEADQGEVRKVCVKGGFNGWAEAEMTLSTDGSHYTYTASGLAGDTYEYGIVVYTTTGPSYGTFCKDYYNMEAVSNGGNSIFTIASSEEYPPEDGNVESPVVEGHNVTFNLYAPGAQSVYVAGSMTTPIWNDGMVEMTYDDTTGYWSTTLQNVEAGTYEYKFVKNGNWITDPLNEVIQNTNSAFTIEADVVSPVVNGNAVTFNFKPSTVVYDSVVVAGTATTWDPAAAPAMEYNSETGIYSLTLEDMVPGTYQYKFVGNPAAENPAWMLDPANAATESGNSAFVIAGLKPATGLAVKKGETLELPSTLTLYAADGTTTEEAVTYVVNGESAATISDGILSVPADAEGESLTLTASTADGEQATVTVALVDVVYNVTFNYYYARNTEPTIDDSDIYVYEVDGNNNTVVEFSDTFTDEDGNVWLTGSIQIPYSSIGAVARITKGSWDGGKDTDRLFDLTDEDTTLWYEFGKELTTTQPTIVKDEDGYDGIKVHFLSEDDAANIYFWGVTPAAAAEAPKWPGLAMTEEGDGWFVYELPGVDAVSLIFNGAFGQTENLDRTTGEWWYAAKTWFDHQPTAEEIAAAEEEEETTTEEEEETTTEEEETSEEEESSEEEETPEEEATSEEEETTAGSSEDETTVGDEDETTAVVAEDETTAGDAEDETTAGSSEDETTVEEATSFEILEGADTEYAGTDAVVIRVNHAIDKFVEVLVDDVVVDPSNYTVTEGSTIITLSEAYLATLAAGKHDVKIKFTDGIAETSLTIKASAAETTASDKGASVGTGDSLPVALFMIMFASVATVVVVSKKRKENE